MGSSPSKPRAPVGKGEREPSSSSPMTSGDGLDGGIDDGLRESELESISERAEQIKPKSKFGVFGSKPKGNTKPPPEPRRSAPLSQPRRRSHEAQRDVLEEVAAMGLDLGLDEPTTTTDVFPSSLRKPLPDIWHSCEIQGFDLEAFRRANNPQLALSAGRKETPTRAKMKIDTSDEDLMKAIESDFGS